MKDPSQLLCRIMCYYYATINCVQKPVTLMCFVHHCVNCIKFKVKLTKNFGVTQAVSPTFSLYALHLSALYLMHKYKRGTDLLIKVCKNKYIYFSMSKYSFKFRCTPSEAATLDQIYISTC